jgi:type IV pilus assembly protein PilZ
MSESPILNYVIKDPVELNLSYMPFVKEGGLFVPTSEHFSLGDQVVVDLQLPSKKEILKITGKVVWISPRNALHYVLPGIGIQFIGTDAKVIRSQIEADLDASMDIGGYTYGM